MKSAFKSSLFWTSVFVFVSFFSVSFSYTDQATRRWSMVDGHVQVEVLHYFKKMNESELEKFSPLGKPLQWGLDLYNDGYPDAVFGFNLDADILQDRNNSEVIDQTVASAFRGGRWKVDATDTTLIAGRSFVVSRGSGQFRKKKVDVIIAATSLGDDLLTVVIMTKGTNRQYLLNQLDVALGTMLISDEGEFASGEDGIEPGQIVQSRKSIPGCGISLNLPDSSMRSYLRPGYILNFDETYVYATSIGLPLSMAKHSLERTNLHYHGEGLVEEHTVVVNDRQGYLCLVDPSPCQTSFRKWILLLGNREESIKIISRFREDSNYLVKDFIRSLMMSVEWDPGQGMDWQEGFGVTFTEATRFRISCRAHDNLVLAMPANGVPLDATKPFVLVRVFDRDEEIDDLAEFSRDAGLNSPLIKSFTIESTSEKQLEAGVCFELSGKIVRIYKDLGNDYYQAVIFSETKYCLIQGFLTPYMEYDLLSDLVKITESIRFIPETDLDEAN